MNRVLLVTYYFPPLGMAGINRPLALAKYLPRYGYSVDVLTVKPVAYWHFEPELQAEIEANAIHRAGSRDPARWLRLIGLTKLSMQRYGKQRRTPMPDSKSGWYRPAVRLGQRVIDRINPVAIISTSPPVTAHRIARALSTQNRLLWIADWRDLWGTRSIDQTFSNERDRKAALAIKHGINTTASAQTAINQTIASYHGPATTVITNSWDDDLGARWRPPSRNQPVRIGLLGTLVSPMTVEPLWRMLRTIRDQYPQAYGNLRIDQVGSDAGGRARNQAEHYGIADVVDWHGQLTRAATIDLLSETHGTYIGVEERHGDGFLTARTFDLMASGRPLLLHASATSELAQLLDPLARTTRFDSESEAVAVDWLTSLAAQSPTIVPCPDDAQPYASSKIAGTFADILDRIVDPTPSFD